MKKLVKNIRREFLIFWGIPKNIYMPISIFSIIFVIFTIIDSSYLLGFSNVFIASLFSVFLMSETTYLDDYKSGFIEKKICETNDLEYYLIGKSLTQIILVFLPMVLISMLYISVNSEVFEEIKVDKFIFSYLLFLITLKNFFYLGSAVSLKRNNALNALVIMPLLIPYFIISNDVLLTNYNWGSSIYLMIAYFIFSDVFCNLITLKVLRIQSR
jgi:heme exporter protein CcmB